MRPSPPPGLAPCAGMSSIDWSSACGLRSRTCAQPAPLAYHIPLPLLSAHVLERSREAGGAPACHVEALLHIVRLNVSWRNRHASTASHYVLLCAPAAHIPHPFSQ